MIKPGCLDHFGGDVAAKVGDLFSNVTEEGIAGPPTQEHDGVNRDMVEIHGHGRRGTAGVQTDFTGGDSEALVVNGAYVGSEELESNGTGHVHSLSRSRHVGVNEGVGSSVKGLEPPDNGSRSFNRAKERMVSS